MKLMRIFAMVCLLAGLSLLQAAGETADPGLIFKEGGEVKKTLTLSKMRSALKVHEITIFDPMYGKHKSYGAFALADVMALAYGPAWRSEPYSDVAFKATDGYEAVSTYDKIAEQGGFLAFKDMKVSGWEPVDRIKANPGPFYVIWSGEKQTTAFGYPWPWQLAEINRVKFVQAFPKVYPDGAEKYEPVMNGYRTFKQRCVRCHAMDGDGGKLGPDLGAPQNILDYRSPEMVKAYIYSPSQFRYSNMPDHTDLSKKQLDDLVMYFRYKQEHKDVTR